MPSHIWSKVMLIVLEGIDNVGKTTLIKHAKTEFPTWIYLSTEDWEKAGKPIPNTEKQIKTMEKFTGLMKNMYCRNAYLTKLVNRYIYDEGKHVIVDRLWLSFVIYSLGKDYPNYEIHKENILRVYTNLIMEFEKDKIELKKEDKGKKLYLTSLNKEYRFCTNSYHCDARLPVEDKLKILQRIMLTKLRLVTPTFG